MNKLKYVFCILVITFPVFNRYSSFVPYLTLADTFLLVFWICSLFCLGRAGGNSIKESLLLAGYFLFQALLGFFRSNTVNVIDAVGTSLRLFYLFVSLAVLAPRYFDLAIGKKVLNVVAAFLSVYALLQIVFAFAFGQVLTTYIPFLSPFGSVANTDYEVLVKMEYGLRFRPCSLLSEPSELAVFVSLPFLINLWGKKSKTRLFLVFLFGATLVLSLASTGLIAFAAILIIYFFSMNSSLKKMVLLVAIVIGALIMSKTSIFSYFMERVFGGDVSFEGLLNNSTRFQNINLLVDDLNAFNFFLGRGFEDSAFIPGFLREFYQMGFVGLTLEIILLVNVFRKGDKLSKKVVLLFALLNVGGELFLGRMILLFIPFGLPQNRVANSFSQIASVSRGSMPILNK